MLEIYEAPNTGSMNNENTYMIDLSIATMQLWSVVNQVWSSINQSHMEIHNLSQIIDPRGQFMELHDIYDLSFILHNSIIEPHNSIKGDPLFDLWAIIFRLTETHNLIDGDP